MFTRETNKLPNMTERQVLHIFTQILLGLKYLHSKGILHRDLKPANIFLSEVQGVAQIGDLGASRAMKAGEDVYNKSQRSTPQYNAIEVQQGMNYSRKSDIYAMGLILYDLCNTNKP